MRSKFTQERLNFKPGWRTFDTVDATGRVISITSVKRRGEAPGAKSSHSPKGVDDLVDTDAK